MLEISPHILVVDDDKRLCTLLHDYLGQNGFWVSLSSATKEADKFLEEMVFDALVLDVMMPEETGIEYVQRFKKLHTQVPVLMLTALGEVENRIVGLESGADDYLSKPFEPKELLLRLKNLLGRSPKASLDKARFGDYEFDLPKSHLSRAGEVIYLTESEASLLKALAGSKGEVVSREALAGILKTSPKSVDVQVGRLRRKIRDDGKTPALISTIRGEGYALRLA